MPNIVLAVAEATEKAAEPNFISTLGINWKLFLAQLLNFGIVIFILWKWVMKPVVGALEARRERIQESVNRAAEIERRMKEFELQRAEDLKKARLQSEEIFKKAAVVADAARQESVAAARAEADRILGDAQAAIEAEKQQMLREIREELSSLTVLATEKILRQRLDREKDRELVSEVLKSIK